MRPVQITTHVRGFPPHKNNFMFEKHLNEKVFAVMMEHWGQKPVLTFCSSRKGVLPRMTGTATNKELTQHIRYYTYVHLSYTCLLIVAAQLQCLHHTCSHGRCKRKAGYAGTVECAQQVQKGTIACGRAQQLPFFVRSNEQLAALQTGAATLQDKALQAMIIQGIAWHHAAMEPQDRATVEQLFLQRHVMFLAATATLAQVQYLRPPTAICEKCSGLLV